MSDLQCAHFRQGRHVRFANILQGARHVLITLPARRNCTLCELHSPRLTIIIPRVINPSLGANTAVAEKSAPNVVRSKKEAEEILRRCSLCSLGGDHTPITRIHPFEDSS